MAVIGDIHVIAELIAVYGDGPGNIGLNKQIQCIVDRGF
jgi:hypothetical protein